MNTLAKQKHYLAENSVKNTSSGFKFASQTQLDGLVQLLRLEHLIAQLSYYKGKQFLKKPFMKILVLNLLYVRFEKCETRPLC